MRNTRFAIIGAIVASLAVPLALANPQGEKVYRKTCVVCHSDGISGAPRLGNTLEWAPRLAAGRDALVASVRNGKGLMPPKGGNPTFTEDELRAAVDYILSKAR